MQVEEGRRIYSANKFTPELVRQDPLVKWRTTTIFYGGKRRAVRYKEVARVLWQSGAKTRPLRLFVIAPTPYRKRNNMRCTIARPLICSAPISTLPLVYCFRSTSTAGKSKSIIARKKTLWASAKPSYATPSPSPDNPP